MDIFRAYPWVFIFTVFLPIAGGLVGAYLGFDALRNRYEDDHHKAEVSSQLSNISSQMGAFTNNLTIVQEYAKLLEQANEKDEVLNAVLMQYTRMKEASEAFSRMSHGASSHEIDELAKHILTTIQSDIFPIRVAKELPNKPLIIKVASNTFRVLFSVPTRIPPKIEFTNLPPSVNATVIENSTFGFTVIFSPQDIPVETFGFIGDARI